MTGDGCGLVAANLAWLRRLVRRGALRSGTVSVLLAALVVGAGAGCMDWEGLSAGGEGVSCAAFAVAGATHSCARLTGGELYCWGDNRFGQLGDVALAGGHTPVAVPLGGATKRITLALGFGDVTADAGVFSCAITTDGALWCWGDNRFGQLGSGDKEPRPALAPVQSLADATNVDGGAGHACARTTEDAVFCWGSNHRGQLGIGDAEESLVPAPVSGLSAKRVACGGNHTCAVATDGAVWCWGDNREGQLGVGTNEERSEPARVFGMEPDAAHTISVGGSHTCALATDSSVWCWGDNRFGQLGDGTLAARNAPTRVELPTGAEHIYAGGHHTCAVLIDGSTWCWGSNAFGQLGRTGDNSPVPVRAGEAELGTEVTAAWAGSAHQCAVKRDGSVWCWGNNHYGQLGREGSSSATPVRAIAPCGDSP